MATASLPPSIGKTVLITGINGYIASTLGHLLLTKGYSVRGTTRSAASVQGLLQGAYAPYASRVSIDVVSDMTLPGAFDSAVSGVHAIFHTASPIGFGGYSYESMVEPAVAGTTTILTSALHHAGAQLESIVVTSSVATIYDPTRPAHVFTEADHATQQLAALRAAYAAGENTHDFPGLYSSSKTAAEEAVWEFRNAHSPPWALATVHPSVTIGPPVEPPADPKALNVTLAPLWRVFSGGELGEDIGSSSFVDVRDVATIHVWAAEHPKESDGERYIACAGFGPVQAAADVLREAYPDRRGVILEGSPGKGYLGWDAETRVVKEVQHPKGRAVVSGAKAEKVTGIKYRTFKESVLDTAKCFERYL